MNESIYKIPESDLSIENIDEEIDFYVVGKVKFIILFFATLGGYSTYWFYRNWKLYKNKNDDNIWPIPRGIFNIFFAHSLFSNVEKKLHDSKHNYSWNPNVVATAYVLLTIISNVCDRLSFQEIGTPLTNVIAIAILPALAYILLKAQVAINISACDPKGDSNSKLTKANYLWIALGCILWSLSALGLLVMFGVIPE